VGLAVAVGTAAATLVGTREPLVCEAKLRCIKVGMSRAEVEAVLGKPESVIAVFRKDTRLQPPTAYIYRDDSLLRRNRDQLAVGFNENRLVDSCRISRYGPDERSLWKRVRDRFAELRDAAGW
jgi:hypothetical protein